MDRNTRHLPVVVVGAGPVGLAAAAHLAERGEDFLVIEAGEQIGAAVSEWGHVRIFSPWRYNIDAAAAGLLEAEGWTPPPADGLPTGADLVEHYLAPLARTAALSDKIQLGVRVTSVSRQGMDKTKSIGRDERPFLVRAVDAFGDQHEIVARAVIDASGTWGTTNPIGSGGLPAAGEAEARAVGAITDPLPDVLGKDRPRFAGRRVVVAGMGHSAANTLMALDALAADEPRTEIVWAIRGQDPTQAYGGGDADQLPARGRLGARLRRLIESGRVRLLAATDVKEVELTDEGCVRLTGATSEGPLDLTADLLVPATGFRPDLGLASELRLDLDPGLDAPSKLAPLIDPNFHSCGTVPPHGERELAHPDTGYYMVGMKSYGRAPTFLLATGYEQVRSVVAALAGDRAAADEVQLDLPETGVCGARLPSYDAAGGTVTLGLATGRPGGWAAEATPVGSCCG